MTFFDKLEDFVETMVFSSRWFLAPLLIGLVMLLIILSFKFFHELWYMFQTFLDMSKTDVLIEALALVDLALIASLLVMIAVSSYENLISRIEFSEKEDKPKFLNRLDPTIIKIKLQLSIVAISSIHLLKAFLTIENITMDGVQDQMLWLVIIHASFVVSAVLHAFVHRITYAIKDDRESTYAAKPSLPLLPKDPR